MEAQQLHIAAVSGTTVLGWTARNWQATTPPRVPSATTRRHGAALYRPEPGRRCRLSPPDSHTPGIPRELHGRVLLRCLIVRILWNRTFLAKLIASCHWNQLDSKGAHGATAAMSPPSRLFRRYRPATRKPLQLRAPAPRASVQR